MKPIFCIAGEGSPYQIVYGRQAEAEQTAADQLASYLEQMTGQRLPVRCGEMIPGGKTILVGIKIPAGGDVPGEEDFALSFQDETLIINGGGARGVLYGVFDLLETLGCAFYAADTEVIPRRARAELPADWVRSGHPAFEYRDLFWSCAYDEALSVKLRVNGCLVSGTNGRRISPRWGGGISYAGPHFVHTFERIIGEDQFAEHPEYFSEINGVRTAKHLYSQLCLTNEEVLRITCDCVRRWLRENPQAKIVSVSQNDSFVNESYCTCPACRAINEEEGSPMGTLLRFVNRVADSLREEFPDVAVDTLSYQFSLQPPKLTRPRDNVIIRFCTGVCGGHAIGHCPSGRSDAVRDRLLAWNGISKRTYVWDYTTDFAHYLSPYPNLRTLQANLRFFASCGVRGVFEQGMYQEGKSGEFGELRAFLLARLLWNPEADVKTLAEDFLQAYYGPAAEFVQAYLDFIHDIVEADGRDFNLFVAPEELFDGLISDADFVRLDELWTKAKEAVASAPFYLEHVLRSELQHRYYSYRSGRGVFASHKEEAYARFLEDCRALGVARLNEGQLVWAE